jgi:carboxymethylenebutenolidase
MTSSWTRTLLVVVALFPTLAVSHGRAGITEEKSSFKSGDRDVRVDRFDPAGAGPFPAVIILNGSNGVEANQAEYRNFAVRLAESGYIAIVLHYFDRTQTTYADRESIDQHYLAWMLTIDDALKYARGLKTVNRKRVGVVGFSLGSFLALTMAATRGRDHIAAVAEYAGGYPLDNPVHKLSNLKKMPPVLILHGEQDDIVPVKEARALESLLKDRKLPYEIKIYDKQKHAFTGDDAHDAAERVFRFLDTYLKKSDAEEPAN